MTEIEKLALHKTIDALPVHVPYESFMDSFIENIEKIRINRFREILKMLHTIKTKGKVYGVDYIIVNIERMSITYCGHNHMIAFKVYNNLKSEYGWDKNGVRVSACGYTTEEGLDGNAMLDFIPRGGSVDNLSDETLDNILNSPIIY